LKDNGCISMTQRSITLNSSNTTETAPTRARYKWLVGCDKVEIGRSRVAKLELNFSSSSRAIICLVSHFLLFPTLKCPYNKLSLGRIGRILISTPRNRPPDAWWTIALKQLIGMRYVLYASDLNNGYQMQPTSRHHERPLPPGSFTWIREQGSMDRTDSNVQVY
jgi:hypothetical protein